VGNGFWVGIRLVDLDVPLGERHGFPAQAADGRRHVEDLVWEARFRWELEQRLLLLALDREGVELGGTKT
jgi:hypothetical protein